MKTKILRKPAQTKKFAAEGVPAADAQTVDTVLDVVVKDAEGQEVNEADLTEEQIAFCAKVASKKFKAFSAMKRKSFNADEESIEVVLPEDIATADVEQIVKDAVTERLVGENPDEVVVEVEMEDEPVEVAEEVAGEEEVKDFAGKKKVHKFSSEDLKEGEKLEGELENAMDNQEEFETLAPAEENESGADGVGDIKKFSRAGVTDKGDATSNMIERMLGEDSVTAAKAKFFAAQK